MYKYIVRVYHKISPSGLFTIFTHLSSMISATEDSALSSQSREMESTSAFGERYARWYSRMIDRYYFAMTMAVCQGFTYRHQVLKRASINSIDWTDKTANLRRVRFSFHLSMFNLDIQLSHVQKTQPYFPLNPGCLLGILDWWYPHITG